MPPVKFGPRGVRPGYPSPRGLIQAKPIQSARTPYEQALLDLGPQYAFLFRDQADTGPSAATLTDNFTDVDGTVLDTGPHTADSGDTWTRHPSASSGAIITSNRLRSSAATGAEIGLHYSSDVPGNADYLVTARFVQMTDTGTTAIMARLSTSAYNGYALLYIPGFNLWVLARYDAGVNTNLATYGDSLSNGEERTGTLKVQGESISGLVDGVVRMEATDTTYTAVGRAGLFTTGTTTPQTTGVHLDWFVSRPIKTQVITSWGSNRLVGLNSGEVTQGTNGFRPGEGSLDTVASPQKGGWTEAFAGLYNPFTSGASRTFVGMARIDSNTSSPQVLFGSRGTAGATQPVCVLEAVYEASDNALTRVHYISNVEVQGIFGPQIWFGVLPVGQWFHWALTVVDNGTTQTTELFINGKSCGNGVAVTAQPTWDANAGGYQLGMRGEGSYTATPSHALVGAHGANAVYTSVLTGQQILRLAQVANLFVPGQVLQQATETDAAQALDIDKHATLVPATSANAAVALDVDKHRTLTPATETDAAVALSVAHRKPLTAASETDTAVALSAAHRVTLTPASETDAARPLDVDKHVALQATAETDLAVGQKRIITLIRASETDSAVALDTDKHVALTPAAETDSAIASVYSKPIRKSLTPATETDTAQALDTDKHVTLTSAVESDAARSVSWPRSLIPASETDAARALDADKHVVLSPAAESDNAVALSITTGGGEQDITVTPATESDSARPLDADKHVALTPATEIDTAAGAKRTWHITAATETDTAQALSLQANGATTRLVWDTRAQADALARALVWDLYAQVDIEPEGREELVWDLYSEMVADQERFVWDVRNPVDGSVEHLLWDLRLQADATALRLIWELAVPPPVRFARVDFDTDAAVVDRLNTAAVLSRRLTALVVSRTVTQLRALRAVSELLAGEGETTIETQPGTSLVASRSETTVSIVEVRTVQVSRSTTTLVANNGNGTRNLAAARRVTALILNRLDTDAQVGEDVTTTTATREETEIT